MTIPKIDLHIHIDGSLDPLIAYQIARKNQMSESELNYKDFLKLMVAPEKCENLDEFLKCFDLPLRLLQDEHSLSNATYNLVCRLAEQGVEYAELRFAPLSQCQKNIDMEEAVLAVLRGMENGMEAYPKIEVNLILCMKYGASDEANYRTVDLAYRYRNYGVVCVDLSGNESTVSMADMKKFFDYAKEKKVPFVIHAGESGPAENVSLAIDYGAKRIGHGIHALEDEAVVNKLIEKKIPLEMCVSCNVQLGNQPSYAEHALKKLYQKGVLTTINTDNLTLNNTNLDHEYEMIKSSMGLTDKDILLMNKTAVEYSFASNEKKADLINKINICLSELL